MSVNKAIIVGHLGKDPELKYTPSQTAVAKFSVATSEKYTDKNGQKKDKAEWHNIVVWGKLAEICSQHIRKGSEVYIEGPINTRDYEDENGVKRYFTEINAKIVQFLGAKSDVPMSDRILEQFGNSAAKKDNGMPF